MADSVRGTSFERDVEQAIVALKKGAHLLRYGHKGRPRFCPCRLSNDERTLIWFCGQEELQLRLDSVNTIVPGQRTANFKRYPQPDKEYQSFSLIFGDESQSIDLICKDKEQAELWFTGLKALISDDRKPFCSRIDRKNECAFVSDVSSPICYVHEKPTLRSDAIQQQEHLDTQEPPIVFESSPNSSLSNNISNITNFVPEHQKNYPFNCLAGASRRSTDLEVGSHFCKDSVSDAYRVSLSSMISSSSQGSAHDDNEALGDVYIWGKGAGNGLLGGGMRIGATMGFNLDAFLPKHLESAVMLDVKNIACGNKHAALVSRQGDLFCWGEESGGRLGHGTNIDVPQPMLVDSLAWSNAEFVACGEYHTCAVTLAGDLYTWGNGRQGISLLGHGNDVSHWVPRKVTLPEGVQVAMVACGPWHTAFITVLGELFTFGDGTFGALGHGDKTSISYPKEVQSLKGLNTIRVACGVWHSAAVVEVIKNVSGGSTYGSGKLFTWGDGDKGCLGHCGKETKLRPNCVSSLVNFDFHQIACGHSLTVALTTSGQVYTMGSSTFGQLGDPLAKEITHVLVQGRLWETFVEEIACGAHHVAVLTSRMDVYTWGKGANGRLGHGDTHDRNTPTRVEALKGKQVKSIACGTNCTAAICLHKVFTGADQSMCSACGATFMFKRKRHNCYNCGHSFCHTCSNKKALRAKLAPNPKKAYRVCDACYKAIRTIEYGAADLKRMATNLLVPHVQLSKGNENKSQLRTNAKQLVTRKVSRFEQPTKSEENLTRRQNVRHESVKRVSPVPSDLVAWTYFGKHNGADSHRVLVKVSPKVASQNTKISKSPSLSQSEISGLNYEALLCNDVTIMELKEKNMALREELSKLKDQLRMLKQQFSIQEAKLQNATKQLEVGNFIARKEASKFRAAREVINYLTLQLEDLALKISHKANNQNESGPSLAYQLAELGARNALAALEGGVLSENEQESFKSQKGLRNIFGNDCAIKSDRSIQLEIKGPPCAVSQYAISEANLSQRTMPTVLSSSINTDQEKQWMEQDHPGVYITVVSFPDGTKELRRVRFNRKKFSESQAEQWWQENKLRVYQQHSIGLGSAAYSRVADQSG